MEELNKRNEAVVSKDDFIAFMESLISTLEKSPKAWVNKSLPDYLNGISSWTEDMDGYYDNMNLPQPENVNWKVMADILLAATMYE